MFIELENPTHEHIIINSNMISNILTVNNLFEINFIDDSKLYIDKENYYKLISKLKVD